MTLTDEEIAWCTRDPSVLRILADQHDLNESMADSQGASSSADYHRARRIELCTEAARFEFDPDGDEKHG